MKRIGRIEVGDFGDDGDVLELTRLGKIPVLKVGRSNPGNFGVVDI